MENAAWLRASSHAIEATGPVVVWIVDTAISFAFGLVLGMIVVGIVLLVGRLRGRPAH